MVEILHNAHSRDGFQQKGEGKLKIEGGEIEEMEPFLPLFPTLRFSRLLTPQKPTHKLFTPSEATS